MQLEIKHNISEVLELSEKELNKKKDEIQDIIVRELTYATNKAKEDAPYRTGTLRRGIMFNIIDLKKNWHFQVISIAPYSSYVEFGTVKMKPRPFFFKNIDRAVENIKKKAKAVK